MTGSPVTTSRGQVRVFEALGEPCGVMVFVEETREWACRFRQDWEEWAGEEADILRGLAEQVETMAHEMGPEAFLQWADDSLSNTFRISEPKTALVGHIDRTLNLFYRKSIPSLIKEFKTHLPVLSIRAAAGGFGQDMAAHAEGWVEVDVPGRKGLSEDLFLIRIDGRSMEPDIPDGSLCLFRSYYGGSRKGGIYLVQRVGTLDEGGEVTIKRYDSRKRVVGSTWEHESIEMQPGNPDFDRWQLDDDQRYATIAQFLCVIEDPERH